MTGIHEADHGEIQLLEFFKFRI